MEGMEGMEEMRARLEAERSSTRGRLRGLLEDHDAIVAASRDTNADDEHDPEGATIAFERSQIDSLVRQARLQLEEIDAAVDRLERETYGICERCDEAIAPGRLEARPTARLCLVCASA